MKTVILAAVVVALGTLALAQEKPVPKDSVRIFVPGCSKGLVFTAGPKTEDQPGRSDVPPGMHLRMNGPKKMMAEIKAHEGSMIEITGLIKKGQIGPDGIGLGGGVRISPGPSGGSMASQANYSQVVIDVEGWRQIPGDCPSR